MTNQSKTVSAQLKEHAISRVGLSIPGGWTLDKLIGFGGAAAVYEASKGVQSVAVKIMHQRLMTSDILRERFAREAEIGMTIDHPNILSVFDYQTLETGEPFMTMELLDGLNVRQYIKNRGGKLPIEEALDIAKQVLSALAVCHKKGIYHRDLKPSNLFVNRSMQVRVLDFGVARLEEKDEQITREGTALGTPSYMPPEQARGRLDLLDARSDLFAVGATIYTMLTGQLLNQGRTSEESLILAATKPAESIARIDATLPAEIIHLVDKALTWNPSKRFQTAYEMISLINRYLESDNAPQIDQMSKAVAMAGEQEVSEALEDLDQQSESDDRSIFKAIDNMFSLSERFMNATIQYGGEHRETRKFLDTAYDALQQLLGMLASGELVLKVAPHSLSHKKEVVWEPTTAPFDQVPYNLFSSGLRRITIISGVTLEEFSTFLQIIKMDPRRDLAPEDDLSTMLWQQNMTNINIQLVSTFQLDDSKEQEQFIQQCKDEQSSVEEAYEQAMQLQIERTQMLLTMGQEALAQAAGMADRLDMSFDDETPAHAGVIKVVELQNLRKIMLTPQVGLEQRLPFVLADAYKEARRGLDLEIITKALKTMIARYVNTHRVLAALTLYGRLCLCLNDRVMARDLTSDLFPEALVIKTIETYIGWLDDTPSQEVALDERNLKHLKELLSHLGPEYGELIANAYVSAQKHRAMVVLFYAYLKRHTDGNEEHIGQMIPRLSLGHCKKLIEMLLAHGTQEALDAMRHADGHSDSTLRLTVLEVRATRQPERVTEQIRSLIHDKETNLRIRTLQMTQKHNISGLADIFKERIQTDQFFDLPYSERRLLLHGLLQQDQRSAYRVALEILKSHGLVANDTRNTTRVLAVEILGRLPMTAEVKEALQGATKRRWWNSKELQDAAQALLDQS